MNAREIEKKAFEDFGEWANQWRKDHPEDEDLDIYTLSLMYPDGKLFYNKPVGRIAGIEAARRNLARCRHAVNPDPQPLT